MRTRKSEQRVRARKLCHCVLVLLDADMASALPAVTLRTPLASLALAALPYGFRHGGAKGRLEARSCIVDSSHTAQCTLSCQLALQRCSARVHLSFSDTDALSTHLAAQCLFFSLERGRFGLPRTSTANPSRECATSKRAAHSLASIGVHSDLCASTLHAAPSSLVGPGVAHR